LSAASQFLKFLARKETGWDESQHKPARSRSFASADDDSQISVDLLAVFRALHAIQDATVPPGRSFSNTQRCSAADGEPTKAKLHFLSDAAAHPERMLMATPNARLVKQQLWSHRLNGSTPTTELSVQPGSTHASVMWRTPKQLHAHCR